MQQKIVEFTHLLRKSGVRVSVAEGLDALTALGEVSVSNRKVFRDTLRTCLVKRGDEIRTFDELFDLYWSGFYDSLKESFGDLEDQLAEAGIDLEQLLERLGNAIQDLDGELNLRELAKALLMQDLSSLEDLIRHAAEQAGTQRIANMLQVGFFSQRTIEQLDLEGAGNQLDELAGRLAQVGMGSDDIEALGVLRMRLVEDLRSSVKRYVERELQTQNHDYLENFRKEMLQKKNFYHLTEDEISRMREVVNRLAQRIKSILSVRKKRVKRGKLDLHNTLRRNMARGGIPFDVVFKHRRKDRPKLVILCDVSSSVANVSRFMLQFMYGLQEAFTKIQCFVFVSDLGDVTSCFKNNDVSSAVEEALSGGDVINVYTRSNFGQAFHMFWKNHLSAVDNRTTVLILGDARNNYHDPMAWCLRDLHNKAKNVVWLNPESPSAWGFGDSVMNHYAPHCDVLEECRNLRQLTRIVDQIVL